jgi:hypothetical protein
MEASMMRKPLIGVRYLVLALACLHSFGLASDRPSARKSGQLAVSVTVVHSTQSPQAPVVLMQCRERESQVSCKARQEAAAAEPVCAATETGTWCWY